MALLMKRGTYAQSLLALIIVPMSTQAPMLTSSCLHQPRKSRSASRSVKDPAILLHCSGCRMVQYCCEEHQRQDWPAHKKDCKAFKSLGLRATFYTDEAMLAAFPLRSYKSFHNSSKPELPAGPCSCTICGKKDTEVKLTRTECCHQVLCDSEYQYPVGSYSRDFCPRPTTATPCAGTMVLKERAARTKTGGSARIARSLTILQKSQTSSGVVSMPTTSVHCCPRTYHVTACARLAAAVA